MDYRTLLVKKKVYRLIASVLKVWGMSIDFINGLFIGLAIGLLGVLIFWLIAVKEIYK